MDIKDLKIEEVKTIIGYDKENKMFYECDIIYPSSEDNNGIIFSVVQKGIIQK